MNEMVNFKALVFRFSAAVLTRAVITFSGIRLRVFKTFLNTVLIDCTFDAGIVDLLDIEGGNLNDNLRDREQTAYLSDCVYVFRLSLPAF